MKKNNFNRNSLDISYFNGNHAIINLIIIIFFDKFYLSLTNEYEEIIKIKIFEKL